MRLRQGFGVTGNADRTDEQKDAHEKHEMTLKQAALRKHRGKAAGLFHQA
jgi:hypothetical protein